MNNNSIKNIKDEMTELLEQIDNLEINITNKNKKNTKTIEFYKLMMENLIYTGIDDLSRNLIVAHILSALTVVSTNARTSMPWLYDSIMYLFSL